MVLGLFGCSGSGPEQEALEPDWDDAVYEEDSKNTGGDSSTENSGNEGEDSGDNSDVPDVADKIAILQNLLNDLQGEVDSLKKGLDQNSGSQQGGSSVSTHAPGAPGYTVDWPDGPAGWQVSPGNTRSLEARVQALESKTASMSIVEDFQGNPTVRFADVNLQVVNGLGATNGNPENPYSFEEGEVSSNGVGNLIVGYNEPPSGRDGNEERMGSHNLVVGPEHNYSSVGGLVVGARNQLLAPYASISAGWQNRVTAQFGSVSGGYLNFATGEYSSVSAGHLNMASGILSSICGGTYNVARGDLSSVTGGTSNNAYSSGSSVNGGKHNKALGDFSGVGGGTYRTAPEAGGWVAGDIKAGP